MEKIKVLIVDGFSNHDWARTTALIRGVLEPTKRFRVDVATCPAKPTDPGFATFRPRLADCDVVLLNCNSLGSGGQWPAELREDFVKFVREGGGVFVFHSANNSFAGWAENTMGGLATTIASNPDASSGAGGQYAKASFRSRAGTRTHLISPNSGGTSVARSSARKPANIRCPSDQATGPATRRFHST